MPDNQDLQQQINIEPQFYTQAMEAELARLRNENLLLTALLNQFGQEKSQMAEVIDAQSKALSEAENSAQPGIEPSHQKR